MSNKIEGIFNANFPQYKLNSTQRLTRGIGNENYRVDYNKPELPSSNSLVITVYHDGQKWKLKRELEVRKIIGSSSGIPLPELLITSYASSDDMQSYLIRTYSDGWDLDDALERKGEVPEEGRANLARELGQILGNLHNIKLDKFGYIGASSNNEKGVKQEAIFSTWSDFFQHLFYQQLDLLGKLPRGIRIGRTSSDSIKILTPQIKNFFEENKNVLSTVVEPKFCHNDTRFGNFVANKDSKGWRINAVLDFEWALGGDPDLDLAYMENWLHFAQYRKGVRGLIPEFIVGYEPHRKIPDDYPKKRQLYHLFRSIGYLNAVFSRDIEELRTMTPNLNAYVATHLLIIKGILDGKFNTPCAYTSWETRNKTNPESTIGTEPVDKLLLKHSGHNDKYEIKIGDVDLLMHPDVFCPAYTSTSIFLSQNTHIPEGSRVLDMFSGSGYHAIKAASRASEVIAIDHSPKAVACISENIQRHGLVNKIKVLQSDVFSSLDSQEKFDVIIANPPLLPGVPKTLLETAVYDPGLQITKKFLQKAKNYLFPNGKIVLLLTDAGEKIGLGGLSFVQELCSKNNMKAKITASKSVGYETYLVVEITKKQ